MAAQEHPAQSPVDLKLISGQCLLLFLYSISTVTSQSLNLPAERFTCGPLNVTCQRWGYTACVHPDGDYYCLSCDHEYLKTLCGTKEEVHGCNLYCTQKAIDYEKEQLKTEFTRETEEMEYYFMTVLGNLNSTLLQNITDQQFNFKKEKDLQENLILQQERDIRKKNNEINLLNCLLGVLVLLVTATVLLIISWWRNCRKREKRSADAKTQEQLLPCDESKTTMLEWLKETETETKGNVCPNGQNDCTQTEDTRIKKGTDEQVHEQPTEEQKEQCKESGCPTKLMLQQIPPTIGQGSNKMAIQNQDHYCDFKS